MVTVWVLQRWNANQIAFPKKKSGGQEGKGLWVQNYTSDNCHIWGDTYFLHTSLALLSSMHVGPHCFIFTSALHCKLSHLAASWSIDLFNFIVSSQHFSVQICTNDSAFCFTLSVFVSGQTLKFVGSSEKHFRNS